MAAILAILPIFSPPPTPKMGHCMCQMDLRIYVWLNYVSYYAYNYVWMKFIMLELRNMASTLKLMLEKSKMNNFWSFLSLFSWFQPPNPPQPLFSPIPMQFPLVLNVYKRIVKQKIFFFIYIIFFHWFSLIFVVTPILANYTPMTPPGGDPTQPTLQTINVVSVVPNQLKKIPLNRQFSTGTHFLKLAAVLAIFGHFWPFCHFFHPLPKVAVVIGLIPGAF